MDQVLVKTGPESSEPEEGSPAESSSHGDPVDVLPPVAITLRSILEVEDVDPTPPGRSFSAASSRSAGNLPPPATSPFSLSEEPPSEIPAPGRNFGEYELLEEIGRGQIGILYKARLRGSAQVVALKMLMAGRLASDNDLGRFRADAEAASRIEHPSIVPLLDFGEVNGQDFCVTGMVEGESLESVLKSGPLEPASAAELVRTLAEAVQCAHEHGVSHRALMPARVMLPDGGPPVISGFGLTRWIEADAGPATGSLQKAQVGYLAPEQAGSRPQDGVAVDVYGLGGILFAALTGRPPFRAGSRAETLRQVLELPVDRPGRFNSTVDSELEAICLRCLSKEPGERYPSMLALANALAGWQRETTGRGASEAAKANRNKSLADMSGEGLASWGRVMSRLAAVLLLVALGLEGLDRFSPGAVVGSVSGSAGLIGVGLLLAAMVAWRERLREGVPASRLEQGVGRIGALCLAWLAALTAIGTLAGVEQSTLLTIALLSIGFTFGCLGVLIDGGWYAPALTTAIASLLMAAMPAEGRLIATSLLAAGLALAGRRYRRMELESDPADTHRGRPGGVELQPLRLVLVVAGNLAMLLSAPVLIWLQQLPEAATVMRNTSPDRGQGESGRAEQGVAVRRISDSRFAPEKDPISGAATTLDAGGLAQKEGAADVSTVPSKIADDAVARAPSMRMGEVAGGCSSSPPDGSKAQAPGAPVAEPREALHSASVTGAIPVVPRFAVINFLSDQGIPAYAAERAPPGIGSDAATGEMVADRLQECTWIGNRIRTFSTKPGRTFRFIQCWADSIKVSGWVSETAFEAE